VIGFAGNFLSNKVDFALLEAVARARPDWTMLLVGPSRPDTADELERLAGLANVRRVGGVPYEEMPRTVAAFDVGLIPYLENDYTRSCSPLKLFEYLAAGKPVVATGLPELRGFEPHVVVAEGVDGTLAAIDAALTMLDASRAAERCALAARNTWETRAEHLLGLVTQEL
jgi:glycosyltransferase involved in cell wall biosynthesis